MHSRTKVVMTHHLLNIIDHEKEFNGATDSTQLIIWTVKGVEIVRSEGGKLTVTPAFEPLAHAALAELYASNNSLF